jgi:hypothetical protein
LISAALKVMSGLLHLLQKTSKRTMPATCKNGSPRNAYSVPMPRIAKAHIVPDYRPLVKDVVKLLRSHGAVPMPAEVRRRLQKAGMHGMPAE